MDIKGMDMPQLDGSTLKVVIVRTRWNSKVVDALTVGAFEEMTERCNVKKENIRIEVVAGSFELPFLAKTVIEEGLADVVIAIGCLIKGETMHFEYISAAVSEGLMRLNIETYVPVIFGVLTCTTADQAIERSISGHNHGVDWGKTAVEMGLRKLRCPKINPMENLRISNDGL